MPVFAESQNAGNSRCPTAACENMLSWWAVQAWASCFGIDRSLGAWAAVATLWVSMPRFTAVVSAPRMMRWISRTVLGASALTSGSVGRSLVS